jgi:hypothetical protein
LGSALARTDGKLTLRARCHYKRSGMSNATLLGAVAALALVSALSMIQSGDLNPVALFASAAPAQVIQTQSGKKKGKAPPLIPREPSKQIELAISPEENGLALQYTFDPWVELSQALARMDAKAAAALLVELDVETAAALLIKLHERDLARILEVTDPADAVPWVLAIKEAAATVADIPAGSEAELATSEESSGLESLPVDGAPTSENTTDSTDEPAGTDAAGDSIDEPSAGDEAVAHVAPARPPPVMNVA